MADDVVVWEERFDDAASVEAWSRTVGATVGTGPKSTAGWEEGAVVLRVDRATEQFLALSQTVRVKPESWLRVDARVRAEALDPQFAEFDACYVVLRVDGSVTTLGPITASTDWIRQQRYIQVPEGASTLALTMFLAMPGVAWFDDLVVTQVASPFRVEARGHYVYHLLGDERITESDHAYNEQTYARIRDWFGAGDLPPVRYFKYADRDQIVAYTGVAANAHLSGGEIHSIWPVDGHEIVHAFARRWWGNPVPMLEEGLAVHLSGSWQGQSVRAYAAQVLRDGQWLSLAELNDHDVLVSDPTSTRAYAIAGALVQWIEETHGRAALERLYRGLPVGTPLDSVDLGFREVLGMDLAGADAALRAWLEASPVDPVLSINAALDPDRAVVVGPAESPAVLDYAREMSEAFFGGRRLGDVEAVAADPTAPYVLYGTPATNDLLAAHAAALPFRVDTEGVEVAGLRFHAEGGVRLYVAAPNPTGKGAPWVIYTATSDALVPGMNRTFHGPTGWLVTDATGRTCGSGFLPAVTPTTVEDRGCPEH